MSETRHHGRVTLVLDSESDKAEDAAYIMVEGETYTALIIFQYNGVVSGTPLVLTPHEMDWLREQSNAIIAARETVLGERDVMAHVFTRQRHFREPPVDLPSVEWILNQQQIRNQAAAGFATTADTTTTGFAPAGSPTGRIQTATSNVLPFANIDYSHLEARMAEAAMRAESHDEEYEDDDVDEDEINETRPIPGAVPGSPVYRFDFDPGMLQGISSEILTPEQVEANRAAAEAARHTRAARAGDAADAVAYGVSPIVGAMRREAISRQLYTTLPARLGAMRPRVELTRMEPGERIGVSVDQNGEAAIVNAADRPLAVPLPANDEQPFESADPPAGIGDINIQAGEGLEVHQEGNQVTISRAPEHVGVPDYSSPAAVQAFWQRTTGTASFVDYARQLLAETRSDDNSNAAQATRQIGVDLGLTPDVVIEDEIVDTDVGDHADEDYDDS